MQIIKLILVSILLTPKILSSQAPVIDADANFKLEQLNRKTRDLNRKLKDANYKIDELKNEQSKSNEYLKKLTELKEEEIETYKNAPDDRLVNYQKQMLTKEKIRIVEQIKSTISSIKDMRYIDEGSKSDLKLYLKDMIIQVAQMWKQTSDVLAINDKIIPASERQTLLESTIQLFNQCISDIEDKEIHLDILNREIKARKELFGF